MMVLVGELGPMVENIVIPLDMICTYARACETLHILLAKEGLSQLNNIFIDVGDRFTFVKDRRIRDELFKTSSVIVPDLTNYDNRMARIDNAASILPGDVLGHWYRHKAMVSDNTEMWQEISGDVMYAWITTKACLSGEISEENYDDFENGVLMHPSGKTWWDYLAHGAPTILPTCVFAQVSDTEKVDGQIREEDELLSVLFND